jgi:hypothetical protein
VPQIKEQDKEKFTFDSQSMDNFVVYFKQFFVKAKKDRRKIEGIKNSLC